MPAARATTTTRNPRTGAGRVTPPKLASQAAAWGIVLGVPAKGDRSQFGVASAARRVYPGHLGPAPFRSLLNEATQLFGAFGFSLVAVLLATPVAIRIAGRTNFFDRPMGYKGHAAPTPYLGGTAVLAGFAAGAFAFGSDFSGLGVVLLGALLLWVVGTLDDRRNVAPGHRVLLESVAAAGVWATGNGFGLFDLEIANLLVTTVWVVAVVNAFNLMDNMDGAASSVASMSALGAGALALIDDRTALAAACLALSGACIGFLPYNLRSPARIFLGDGGSMPIGFIVAATTMAVASGQEAGSASFLLAVALVGLPVLDTALVVISRRRRGVSFLTGGRDHVTHRLRRRLPSARAVAATLGFVQACLCVVSLLALQLGSPTLFGLAAILLVLGVAAIGALEQGSWALESTPFATSSAPAGARSDSARRAVAAWTEHGLLAGIGFVGGLSAFASGFYDLSTWGPIGMGALVLLVALFIARPQASHPRVAVAALAGTVGTAAWATLSMGWGESADAALLEGARWTVYAVVLWVLVRLVRGLPAAYALLGGATAALIVVAGYVTVGLLAGDADLFLGPRLNGPVGYVNAQASYLLLGFWPLVATAERAQWAVARGVALGLATLVLGLVLLTQTRAVLPALVLTTLAMVLLVPARERRMWALLAVAAGIGIAADPVLEIYRSGTTGGGLRDAMLADGARALIAASACVAAVWALATAAAPRLAAGRQAGTALLAARGGLVLALAAGLAVLALAFGNPITRINSELDRFVSLQAANASDTRFFSGAGNRYDYWRIAIDEFRSDPVKGVGAGNFAAGYFADRRTSENIRQPHSVQLQALAELGLVGGALLLLVIGSVVFAFGRLARAARVRQSLIWPAVAAGGIFLTWLVHTSVDWLHLLPGLTIVGLGGAAVLLSASPRGDAAGGRRVALRAAAVVAVGLLAVATAGRATVSEHFRIRAADRVASAPAAAAADATAAIRFNGQSVQAYYALAAARARQGSYPLAKAAILEARGLEPSNFVTWALLGDLEARRGNLSAASEAYRRAAALNPRDQQLAGLARDPASALGD